MDDALLELDAEQLLAESSTAVRERRAAEVRDLEVLAQWAAVHSADPTDGPDGRLARKVGNVLVPTGGEGTPGVQDFSLGEIALARGTGVTATANALADVMDLMHRLPLTWTVCKRAEAEIFVARRVAKLSRHLPLDRVGLVDAAIARIIARESGGRVLDVAEAKIIEADPELHQQRWEEEQRRRYVSLSRTDEAGLRTVIARVEAGDAVWVDATVARVAEIIAPQHPDLNADEIRSVAFCMLARPAELLALLLEHTEVDEDGSRQARPAEDPARPAEDLDDGRVSTSSTDGRPARTAPELFLNRALAFPADLLDALRSTDLTRLAPRCVLYVHLHESVLRGADGVARVEGLGAFTLAQLRDLLGRARVKVQPVVDLSDRVRTTAYEHPEKLKERVHLVTDGDYWPFATSTSRRVDYDHPTPYVDPGDGGPPGQTGTHNSGPLGRRHHRWKTHAGYRSRQCGQGRYVWLTPHGLGFLVDHTGTRRITRAEASMILEAPPGVDVYTSDRRVTVDLLAR